MTHEEPPERTIRPGDIPEAPTSDIEARLASVENDVKELREKKQDKPLPEN